MIADPKEIYDRLIVKHNFSKIMACAILGNMQQESNFDTASKGFDGTGSTGLCQWLGPRLCGLIASAKSKKVDPSDWKHQVDFLVQELNTTEKNAFKKLKSAPTLATATISFSKYYERPAEQYANNAKRLQYATHFFREFD